MQRDISTSGRESFTKYLFAEEVRDKMLMNKRLKFDVELGDCAYALENKFVFLSAWTIFTHHEIS